MVLTSKFYYLIFKIHELPELFKRTGLGLLLVREILDYYNGSVWIEDRVAGDSLKGSKFVVLIPEYLTKTREF